MCREGRCILGMYSSRDDVCVGRGDVSLACIAQGMISPPVRAERGDVSLACIAQGMTCVSGGEMYPW